MWVGTKLHGNLEILQKGTALYLPYQSIVKNKKANHKVERYNNNNKRSK